MGHPSEGPRSRQVSLLTLSVLDLSKNNFGDGGLLALCRGLTHFLKGMLARSGTADSGSSASSLGGGGFSSAATAPLVCLRVLKLSHNKCGDKAATCPGYIPLEELSIGQNPIGVAGEERTDSLTPETGSASQIVLSCVICMTVK